MLEGYRVLILVKFEKVIILLMISLLISCVTAVSYLVLVFVYLFSEFSGSHLLDRVRIAVNGRYLIFVSEIIKVRCRASS